MEDPAARAAPADTADAHATGAGAIPPPGDRSRSLRRVGPHDVGRALERFSQTLPRRVVREGSIGFHFSVGRWSPLSEAEDGDLGLCTCHRELEGCFVVDDRPVGYALFDEYRPAVFASDAAFWDDCDGSSSKASGFAEAVLSRWPASGLGGDTLVEFARLWMQPGYARSSEWAPVIRRLVRERWASRRPTAASLFLLKPFPLEMEATRDPDDPVTDTRLERRTAAMRRLYGRLLGVRPLRGTDYMWRTFSGRARSPSRKPRNWQRHLG